MESRVFLEEDRAKKLAPYPHPHEQITAILKAACEKPYDALYRRHLTDYTQYFNRAAVDFGGESQLPTDLLLQRYRRYAKEQRLRSRLHLPPKQDVQARYLEELYFQYGRYLLIASSRAGTPPANLQGTWNCHDNPPWSCGYWHNINVQMNYWPAFSTNLAEMFTAYAEYNRAYLPLAERKADEYIGFYTQAAWRRPVKTVGRSARAHGFIQLRAQASIPARAQAPLPPCSSGTLMRSRWTAVCWSRSIPFYMAWQAFFPKH